MAAALNTQFHRKREPEDSPPPPGSAKLKE